MDPDFHNNPQSGDADVDVPVGVLNVLLADQVVLRILKMYKDSNLTERTLSEIAAVLASVSPNFAAAWKAWGHVHIVSALLRIILQRAHADPTDVLFLMCFKGCCLVVDPHNTDGVTAVSVQCSDGGDIPTNTVFIPDWECPHCGEIRIKIHRYSSIIAKVRALFADDKFAALMKNYASQLEVPLARVNAALDAGEDFDDIEPDVFFDVYDGSNFFYLVKEMRSKGIRVTADDLLIAMNYDGVELVKNISAWPVLIMFYSLGVFYRTEKSAIHMCNLAGGMSSPKDLNSFLWPFVFEMRQAMNGFSVTYKPATGAPVTKTVRMFCLVTCQDLMALLKTSGLAVVNGKCCCPCCFLPGQRKPNGEGGETGSTHYMPRSVLPPEFQPKFHDLAGDGLALLQKYERTDKWLAENLATLAIMRDGGVSRAGIGRHESATGLKRTTPLMALPNRSSIPGGFFAFDAMHTLHHNAWNNIIIPVLKLLSADAWGILSERAEGSHVPHDMQVSFQRLVDPLKLSSKKYKGLKAADKTMLMYYFLPSYLFGLIPSDLYWAIVAFAKTTRLLCAYSVSRQAVDNAKKTYWEVFCVLDSYFPTDGMKLTVHLMIHAADWVRKNGPLRHTWLYCYERVNQDICGAARSNRVPAAAVLKRFRIHKQVMLLERELTTNANSSANTVDPELQAILDQAASKRRSSWRFVSVSEDDGVHRTYAFGDVVANKDGRDEYATLYNTSYEPSTGAGVDLASLSSEAREEFLKDQENTSVVFRSAAYYTRSGVRSMSMRKMGDYSSSAFVVALYEDDNGVVKSAPALVLAYRVTEDSAGKCSAYAKLRWLDVSSPLNLPLTASSHATSTNYRSVANAFDNIPRVVGKNDDATSKYFRHFRDKSHRDANTTVDTFTFSQYQRSRRVYEGILPEAENVLPFTIVRLPCAAEDMRGLSSASHSDFAGNATDNHWLPISVLVCKAILSPFRPKQQSRYHYYAFTPVELDASQ